MILKKAAAIASAADEKAGGIIQHREEWKTPWALVITTIAKNDFDKAKLAKITAETLKLRQEANASVGHPRRGRAAGRRRADRAHTPGERGVGDGDHASSQLAAPGLSDPMWRGARRTPFHPILAPLSRERQQQPVLPYLAALFTVGTVYLLEEFLHLFRREHGRFHHREPLRELVGRLGGVFVERGSMVAPARGEAGNAPLRFSRVSG